MYLSVEGIGGQKSYNREDSWGLSTSIFFDWGQADTPGTFYTKAEPKVTLVIGNDAIEMQLSAYTYDMYGNPLGHRVWRHRSPFNDGRKLWVDGFAKAQIDIPEHRTLDNKYFQWIKVTPLVARKNMA
jgi:hypothetical protein